MSDVAFPAVLRRLWNREPSVDHRIDFNNPLSEGLVSFITTNGCRVSGFSLVPFGNAKQLGDGTLYSPGGSGDGGYVNFSDLYLNIKTDFSIFLSCRVVSGTTYSLMYSIPYRYGSWNEPYASFCFGPSVGGPVAMSFAYRYTGTLSNDQFNVSSSVNFSSELYKNSFYSFSKTTLSSYFFCNGVFSNTSVAYGDHSLVPDFSNKQNPTLLNQSSTYGGNQYSGYAGPLIVFSRYFSQDETLSIYDNPWQLFCPSVDYFFLDAPSEIQEPTPGVAAVVSGQIKKSWDREPPLHYRPDFNNPLCDSLVGFVTANGCRVNDVPVSYKGNTVPLPDGTIYSPGDTGDGAYIQFPQHFIDIKSSFSIVSFAQIVSSKSYGCIAQMPNNAAGTDPYQGFGFFLDDETGKLSAALNGNIGYNYVIEANSGFWNADSIYRCRAVSKNSSLSAFFYLDRATSTYGTSQWNRGTFGQSPSFDYRQSLGLFCFSALKTGGEIKGILGPQVFFSRPISYDEVALLNENIWQLLSAPIRYYFFDEETKPIEKVANSPTTVIRRLWDRKPPSEYVIDQSNPLSQHLVAYITSDGEHVSGKRPYGSYSLVGDNFLTSGVKTSYFAIPFPSGFFNLTLTNRFSFVSFAKVLGLSDSWSAIFYQPYWSIGWSSPWSSMTSARIAAYPNLFGFGYAANDSTYVYFGNGLGFVSDGIMSCRGFCKDATSSEYYKDSVFLDAVTPSTANLPMYFPNKRALVFGNKSDVVSGSYSNIEFGPQLFFSTKLSHDDFLSINENPWQFFVAPRYFFSLYTGGAFVFSGGKWKAGVQSYLFDKSGKPIPCDISRVNTPVCNNFFSPDSDSQLSFSDSCICE